MFRYSFAFLYFSLDCAKRSFKDVGQFFKLFFLNAPCLTSDSKSAVGGNRLLWIMEPMVTTASADSTLFDDAFSRKGVKVEDLHGRTQFTKISSFPLAFVREYSLYQR